MAETSNTTATELTSVTAAIHSANLLAKIVDGFNDDDTTLSRLQPELRNLIEVLNELQGPIDLENPMMTLLKGPVVRCRQLCDKFKDAMNKFDAESNARFLDFDDMEFMGGNILNFMNTLSNYRRTISVGYSTIILQTSEVNEEFPEEHNKMIESTNNNLNVQLRRIGKKQALLMPNDTESSSAPDTLADLEDEKAVTEQCLRICQDSKSYLESLTDREESPKRQMAIKDDHSRLGTHVLALQTHGLSQDGLSEIIGGLKTHLEFLEVNGTPQGQRERSQVERYLKTLTESREGFRMTSEVLAQRKIYSGGELEADKNSDQVAMTTQADLFRFDKAKSTNSSAQWFGSSTDETAQLFARHRYGSYFGVMKTIEAPATFRETSHSSAYRQDVDRLSAARETTSRQPESNETRKRGSGTGNGNANR